MRQRQAASCAGDPDFGLNDLGAEAGAATAAAEEHADGDLGVLDEDEIKAQEAAKKAPTVKKEAPRKRTSKPQQWV